MGAPEYPGNAIPGATFKTSPYTTDPELLVSANNYERKGVTLKPGQGVLRAGTFLSQDSATKMYVKETTPGDVKGVLMQAVDTGTDADGQVYRGNIYYRGTLNLAMISEANSGVAVASVLNAVVDEVVNSFRI